VDAAGALSGNHCRSAKATRVSRPDLATKIRLHCDIASGFELTLPSRFSPSSALALTLAFITVAFCAPPTLPAERGVGVGRDVDVTGDFDGDGIFDSATLRDGRIALSLSERQTTVQLRALSDTI